VAGATRGLDAAAKIAKAVGEPAHLWQVAGVEAMLAIAAGRLAEADELVERAFAIGQRVLPDAARTVHALQRCTLLDFGGVPDQARAALADVVATHPARPALRCALAYVDARAGHAEEAGAALADLVAAGLPFDQEWLFGMSFLAETATLLGERAAAAALYPALRPWSVLNVADQGEGIRGAVARYLGLLAPLAGPPPGRRIALRGGDRDEHPDGRPAMARASALRARGAPARARRSEAGRRPARRGHRRLQRARSSRTRRPRTRLGLTAQRRRPEGSVSIAWVEHAPHTASSYALMALVVSRLSGSSRDTSSGSLGPHAPLSLR
jgi:hypothetical protein